MTFEIE